MANVGIVKVQAHGSVEYALVVDYVSSAMVLASVENVVAMLNARTV